MYSGSHYLTIFKDVAVQNLTRTQCLKPWRKALNPRNLLPISRYRICRTVLLLIGSRTKLAMFCMRGY